MSLRPISSVVDEGLGHCVQLDSTKPYLFSLVCLLAPHKKKANKIKLQIGKVSKMQSCAVESLLDTCLWISLIVKVYLASCPWHIKESPWWYQLTALVKEPEDIAGSGASKSVIAHQPIKKRMETENIGGFIPITLNQEIHLCDSNKVRSMKGGNV